MALPSDNQNGKHTIVPELVQGVIKVVVVGDPNCGKTTFIRAFYDHHEPGDIWFQNGVRVYQCEYEIDNMGGTVEIFEIPGDDEFQEELRTPHYDDAAVIVFMYAIDDPISFELLIDTWLPEVLFHLESNTKPIVVMGNKRDLRDDPEVIERLAMENEMPVTFKQGEDLLVYDEIDDFLECSSYNLEEVNEAFNVILSLGHYNES